MKTQNAAYMPDLDVLRALAAITVFFWHYLHTRTLLPEQAYVPGVALLEEGHVGVSLFMVLSGYLFFKITYRKKIDWRIFAWNRVKRIGPLLMVVQLVWLTAGVLGLIAYTPFDFLKGFILPAWPGVAWSITVELHFYILLPFLLWLTHRSTSYLFAFFCALLLANVFLIADLAPSIRYYTIIGRLDQFVLGALCLVYWDKIPKWCAAMCFALFLIYLEIFNAGGGHARFNAGDNVYLPPGFMRFTVEGLGFAALLVWVLKSGWRIKNTWIWAALAWVGTVSYSFYMLHYFVWKGWSFAMISIAAPEWLQLATIMPAFALTLVVSWAGYTLIEKPFLQRRAKYVDEAETSLKL